MSEDYSDSLKQISCLTVNFNLIYYIINVLTIIFKMPSCGLNACIETSVPLLNAVVNNAVLHSNSHINQTLPQVIVVLHFSLVDLLPQML